jgi:Reverse transcriptase (RNA-dependent DNA polymerase)
MEKLIDQHIRSKYLVRHPLHKMQFAYQAGKSTVSALHHLATKIEKALRYKEVALSPFMDIQGAFDNTGFESIRAAAVSRHIDPESVEWIIGIRECRIVTAGLGEEQVTVKTTRGCPQGGVLSPLLWSLMVIDELLNDLDRQGYEVIGFADDLVITVRGNNDSILSERMQSALSYIIGWCK